jgi:flagellar motor switch/type III secretory pathway protein FliN
MATALALPQPALELIAADAWLEAGWLPCRLRAEIQVSGFTVGDLLTLEVGSIVDSRISTEADVCLNVNGAHVGSGKLDLAESRIAVRLTELV